MLNFHGIGAGSSPVKEREFIKEIANLNSYANVDTTSKTLYDQFNQNNSFSIGKLDLTKANITSAISAGNTILTGKVDGTPAFKKGQQVSIVGRDANNNNLISEDVLITKSFLEQQSVTNTVTDATVVNSAYMTSASARPVVLSNGWIVSVVNDTTGNKIVYLVSKDNGANWSQLAFTSTVATNLSLVSKGNTVYLLYTNGSSEIRMVTFDATTVSNVSTSTTLIETQTATSGISLTISQDGTTLWGAWSSKNASLANSFNIRACKGTIQSDGSVVWSSVEQVTSHNDANYNRKNPSITLDSSSGKPFIIHEYSSGTIAYRIVNSYFNGTAWSSNDIYNGGTYTQANPQVISDKTGALFVVWHGMDATDTGVNNIRISTSSDGGATWATPTKLTSGGVANHVNATITANDNNDVFVLWQRKADTNSAYHIYKIKYSNGTWGSITAVTSIGANDLPSSVYDLTLKSTEPLFVHKNSSKVSFYGTWQTIKDVYSLETSPTTNSYKSGAMIARSTARIKDGKLKFGVLNESTQVTNTITDATVVNSAYDTSGNGGRKLVRLSNGWIVAVVKNGTSTLIWEVSKDNGSTFQQLAFSTISNSFDVSLAVKGNILYTLVAYNPVARVISFDVTTVTNTEQASNFVNIDNGQTAFSGVSLAINEAGTELHSTWASKNSTYPNSFNIRYAKGTINADGSVTWGTVEQVTKRNVTGDNVKNPSIIVLPSGEAVIFAYYEPSNGLIVYKKSGLNVPDAHTNWTYKIIYGGFGSYPQDNPSAIFVPQSVNGLANGRIWVAWHGTDSIDTTAPNIRVSYSDDGGVTWSAMQKLTSGNSDSQQLATLTANKNGEIYVLWSGVVSGSWNIRKIKYNGTWGTITNVKLYGQFPSTLFDLSFNFTEPLFIYKDTTKVGFYGTWTTGSTVETPLFKSIARYNITSPNKASKIISWISKSKESDFTVKSYISSQVTDADEIYTITTNTKNSNVNNIQEKEFIGSSSAKENNLTFKIEMDRLSVNENYIEKVLGYVK